MPNIPGLADTGQVPWSRGWGSIMQWALRLLTWSPGIDRKGSLLPAVPLPQSWKTVTTLVETLCISSGVSW